MLPTRDNFESCPIRKGMNMPIRAMKKEEAKMTIVRALHAMCSAYGVDQPSPDAMTLAVDMVQKRFGQIGANEILHAAQLHAAGSIAPDAKFYSRLNLKALGEILSAYAEYRLDIVIQATKERDAIQEAQAERERAEKASKQYDASFPDLLKSFAAGWEDVPAHWYDTAIRLGVMPEPDPEYKREVWQRAKELASRQTEKEASEEKNVFTARAIFRKLEDTDSLEGKRVAIAKKLIVWESLLAL